GQLTVWPAKVSSTSKRAPHGHDSDRDMKHVLGHGREVCPIVARGGATATGPRDTLTDLGLIPYSGKRQQKFLVAELARVTVHRPPSGSSSPRKSGDFRYGNPVLSF